MAWEIIPKGKENSHLHFGPDVWRLNLPPVRSVLAIRQQHFIQHPLMFLRCDISHLLSLFNWVLILLLWIWMVCGVTIRKVATKIDATQTAQCSIGMVDWYSCLVFFRLICTLDMVRTWDQSAGYWWGEGTHVQHCYQQRWQGWWIGWWRWGQDWRLTRALRKLAADCHVPNYLK